MGLSNVTHNLERAVAAYRGELEDKLYQIERIEALVTSLPTLKARVTELESLIDATKLLMRERKPDWSPDAIKPVRRNEHNGPIPFGEGTRIMLDILKTSARPMKTRELAEEMLARVGIFEPERKIRERVQSSVDAALRARDGTVVMSDGSNPRRWWIVGNQKAESAARAALELVSGKAAAIAMPDCLARKRLGIKGNLK